MVPFFIVSSSAGCSHSSTRFGSNKYACFRPVTPKPSAYDAITRSRSALASAVLRHSASRCFLRLFIRSSFRGPGSLHGTEKKRRVASRIPSRRYVTPLTIVSPLVSSVTRSTAVGGRLSGWKKIPATSLSSSTRRWCTLERTCTSGGACG